MCQPSLAAIDPEMMQEDEVPDAEEEEQQVKQKRAMALLPCTGEAERK